MATHEFGGYDIGGNDNYDSPGKLGRISHDWSLDIVPIQGADQARNSQGFRHTITAQLTIYCKGQADGSYQTARTNADAIIEVANSVNRGTHCDYVEQFQDQTLARTYHCIGVPHIEESDRHESGAQIITLVLTLILNGTYTDG